MNNQITFVDRTDDKHRSNIIIRTVDGYNIAAEFDTVQQLEFFMRTVGMDFTMEEWKEIPEYGFWRRGSTSHRLVTHPKYFWSMEEIPADARPIKALSNGSIVTCYFTNNGETVTIYRPNPNAHAVYQPLTIEEHIAHRNIYGLY